MLSSLSRLMSAVSIPSCEILLCKKMSQLIINLISTLRNYGVSEGDLLYVLSGNKWHLFINTLNGTRYAISSDAVDDLQYLMEFEITSFLMEHLASIPHGEDDMKILVSRIKNFR